MPIRTGEPSDAAFVVEMARLASAVEGRLPAADDPRLAQGLPPSPDTSVLALDADGDPMGAAWWHLREPLLALNVDIRNPAFRLYRRAGFVVEGKGRGPLGVAMVVRLPGEQERE